MIILKLIEVNTCNLFIQYEDLGLCKSHKNSISHVRSSTFNLVSNHFSISTCNQPIIAAINFNSHVFKYKETLHCVLDIGGLSRM